MIHQWQFDLLHQRPDHGQDFRLAMERINRGGMEVVIYHSCSEQVTLFTRYLWSCVRCGHLYHRQRRTIHPRRHRCGLCLGRLKQLDPARVR